MKKIKTLVSMIALVMAGLFFVSTVVNAATEITKDENGKCWEKGTELQEDGSHKTINEEVECPEEQEEVVQKTCSESNAAACLTQAGTRSKQIIDVLKIGITILSGAVGVVAVIMLIIGGIQYSASNGDPSGVKAAKTKITNVLIGLLAYVFLYAFLQWLIPGGVMP